MSECSRGRTPWNKGVSCTEEQKQKQSKTIAGRKTIIKNGVIKRPPLEKLQSYLDDGWKLTTEIK